MAIDADSAGLKELHELDRGSAEPLAGVRIRYENGLKIVCFGVVGVALVGIAAAFAVLAAPMARADNKRLNDGVVASVYTVQHQAGCTNDVTINGQLQRAAEWHVRDLMGNRTLDGDLGSDGSTPESRAAAAGFRGSVAETVAVNPAVAISSIELIKQWYYDPGDYAIMANCANTQVGVWSENSADRTVVVAVYGQGKPSQRNVPIDPSPDYDASDELEFAADWIPWILRGAYPPPDYPPS